MKIAELAAAENNRADTEAALEKFLSQFPDSSQSDIALLTLGESYLADYAAQPMLTDHLSAAQKQFDRLLAAFPDSPLAGKVHLDRGWWASGFRKIFREPRRFQNRRPKIAGVGGKNRRAVQDG